MATGLEPITRVSLPAGTGNVVGPSSSVNDRIAVFNGTTGKLIADGGSTIADIVAGSGGLVTSVFGRTGAIVAQTNDYTWGQLNFTTSSLADITTRSAGDLSSGFLLAARMPALTGDVVTTAGAVSTAITNNAVTLAKMADIATASFLGRNTAGTGDPEVLSIATSKTMLGLTGSNSGDVTLAGQNYLSIAGQVITANPINLTGSHVTGILGSANGGTGSAFFGVAGLSALRSFTFPDAAATIARTDTGQTFTGTNNFGHVLPALTGTYDLGSALKPWRKGWLSELDAVLFATNTASVIGGWLIIAKNEGLIPAGADIGSGDTTIDFGQTMTANDFVLFRAALQVEYVQVGTLVSGTRYNVTRNVDGSGANAWAAGTVYLVLGNTGSGRIELNSNSTPRISLITQGSAYNTQTEILRIGDLNGSWNVSSETYGFGVGQYGVAGKSSLRIDDSGIRFYNNITERIRLLADGSGYLANSSIAWNTSGNLTVTGNANIAGWSVTPTQLSSGNVRVASGQNRPASGPFAWFGTGSTETFYGWELRDSGGRFVQALAGVSTNYPYISVFDATHTRLVIGGLNLAFESDGATASVGMKIWNAAGTKLVEFSDVQNIIAGWSISSTAITSGSGASTVALDTTVTGGDDIRIYAGSSTASSAPFRVTESGALTATNASIVSGSGNVTINSAGLQFTTGTGSSNAIRWLTSGNEDARLYTALQSAGVQRAQQFVVNENFTDGGGKEGIWSTTVYNKDGGGAIFTIVQASNSTASYAALGSIDFDATGGTYSPPTKFGLLIKRSAGATDGFVNAPETSAVLELRSTTGAFLLTRLTSTERDALTAVNGMVIYNTTTDKTQARAAGAWVDLH